MDLRVFLKMDGSGFQQGLLSAENRVAGFNRRIVGAIGAAFSVGMIASIARRMTSNTVEFADRMGDTAQRLEVNVEWLQAMEYALRQNNAQAEDLVGFMERLNASRIEALTGKPGNEKLKAFGTLGVGETDLRSMRVSDLVEKVAKSFETGAADKLVPALRDVGGRGAGALVASFTEGLNAKMKDAYDRGAVMSAQQIAAFKAVTDAMAAFAQQITVETAPAILGAMKILLEAGYGLKTAFAFVSGAYKDNGGFGKALYYIGKMFTTNPFPLEMLKEFNVEGAKSGARKSAEDYSASMNRLDEHLKQLANGLKNPTAYTGFNDLKFQSPTNQKIRMAQRQSDSLLSVGNFLGSGRSAIESLTQETNRLLRDSNQWLEKIYKKSSASSDDTGFPD